MKQVFKVVREPTMNLYPAENVTLGRLYLDNVFFCHSCEDEDRVIEGGVTEKINGRTAIPRGRYRLTTSFSNRFQRVLPLASPAYESMVAIGLKTHMAAFSWARCVLQLALLNAQILSSASSTRSTAEQSWE